MRKLSLALFSVVCATSVHAQMMMENFETPVVGENLEGYNGWTVSSVTAEAGGASPKVKAGSLIYKGYVGSEKGNSVELLKTGTGRTSFKNTGLTIPSTGASVYAAMLVNVSGVQGNNFREFFSFDQSKENTYFRARILVKYDNENNKVVFAVVKGATKPEVIEPGSTSTLGLTLDPGQTHLLVLKYTAVDGKNNDEISLFVNPDLSKSESKQDHVINAADNAETGDYGKGTPVNISIRQRGVAAQLGGIVVSNSWNDLSSSGKKKK